MEIIREKRPQSPVHKTRGKDLGIGSLSFPFHETARETSCSSEFFFVLDLERHEIHIFLSLFCASHGGEKHCAAHLDNYRTVSLLGEFSGLDLDYPSVG